MQYKTELFHYDIYPKAFPCDKEITVTVKPLGAHVAFGGQYQIHVRALNEGDYQDYPARKNIRVYDCVPNEEGCLQFRHVFKGEQEHYVEIYKGDRRVVQLSVYSLLPDLASRYPFRGDLHMHTCRSDGTQSPAVVASEYRKNGYDFLAITDHGRYYPSLEAMHAFQNVPIEYTLIPGEEVHLPDNDVHIVNFGGTYSINGLIETSAQINEMGIDENQRSLSGDCPAVLSVDEYKKQVNELAETLPIPDGIEKFVYASCVWAFRHIKAANGLGIFAHPYWISSVFQVPESLTEYMMATQPFDAFEVLGGENYFEQNGFQTQRYYEDMAKGRHYPIVGSTDSHNCFNNRNGYICSTIVFARENTREDIIASIKDFYSVAVDSISKELRLVGETRFVKYGCFLLREFFPLHDELTFEEGRLMKDYACGNAEAAEDLKRISGRMQKQREKYFVLSE